MVVFTLLIINKAGGLIYTRTFHSGLSQLSTNDYLILAGTFHGIHAISARLCPPSLLPAANASAVGTSSLGAVTAGSAAGATIGGGTGGGGFAVKPGGIEVLESETFKMHCLSTATGTKFLLFTEPGQVGTDVVLRRVYELYADYVLKNPFYQTEMPIRCEAFDRVLGQWVGSRQ